MRIEARTRSVRECWLSLSRDAAWRWYAMGVTGVLIVVAARFGCVWLSRQDVERRLRAEYGDGEVSVYLHGLGLERRGLFGVGYTFDVHFEEPRDQMFYNAEWVVRPWREVTLSK